jgi:Fic family protein
MTHPTWRPDKPWNDLPRLMNNTSLESVTVLRRCIGARAALAGLKEAAALIPNPSMLINTLPVLEAQASSAIENIVTTADELFQHSERNGNASLATKEALRYRTALLEAYRDLGARPLNTRTAELACTRIKDVQMAVRRVPGTRLQNLATGEIIYTPPEGEPLLRELLADWELFLHDEGPLDPLVRMAAAHYQFEAIHPFTDGNGRTGRVLNSIYLAEQGLLPLPILYLSRYVLRHRAEYYARLLAVTRDDAWEPWIVFMLDAVEDTAEWTRNKIGAIRELSETTRDYIRGKRPKIYSHELVQVLFAQPYCRIANLVESGIVARQAAARWLKELVEIGVLREVPMGREKLFLNTKLLALLTGETDEVDGYS